MKRNNKTFGQIKEEVRESEAIKRDFNRITNQGNGLTNEQRYNLFMAVIALFGVIGFFAVLALPFILS